MSVLLFAGAMAVYDVPLAVLCVIISLLNVVLLRAVAPKTRSGPAGRHRPGLLFMQASNVVNGAGPVIAADVSDVATPPSNRLPSCFRKHLPNTAIGPVIPTETLNNRKPRRDDVVIWHWQSTR
jgi:hypothetical protein